MEKLAYLAGLLDGEGSFELHNRGGRFFSPGPRLSISSTTKRLLDWVLANFGGELRQRAPYAGRLGKHRVWTWTEGGQKAINLIERVRPFLVEKGSQAWLLLEYWASRKRAKRIPPTEEELALRYGFVEALKNARRLDMVEEVV